MGSENYATEVYDKNGETIATLAWYPIKTQEGFTTNRDENARLIAAAPEMLAALKGAKPFFDEDFPDGADGPCAVTVEYRDAYKAMLAAIAKATGEI